MVLRANSESCQDAECHVIGFYGPVHSQALSLVMKRTDHCEVRGTAYWWKDFQKTFKRLSKVFVPTLTTSTQDLEREYKSHQLVD
jgi:hypothetical protein